MKTTQKILLGILYALIVLMIVFSITARNNIGQKGYDKCVEKKCEHKGEEFGSKVRELNNCCLGAGGQLGQSDGQYACIFP